MKKLNNLSMAVLIVLSSCAILASGPSPVRAAALSKDAKVRVRIIPPVYLWCHQPDGDACERASGALGVAPVQPHQVPGELLQGYQDLQNDCEDERVRQIIARIEGPLSLDGSWADQVGNVLPSRSMAQRYEGGGCISSGSRGQPTVKIHTQPSSDPQLVLVRVWEVDSR